MSVEPELTRHPHGITTVDALYVRPGLAAIHVIERNGRAAIVDTGANASVPGLYWALEQLGIARTAVDLIFLTHVHLDHAGAAGLLAEGLPNARVSVHPRGVQHLVDPSRLAAATAAVYGAAAFEQLYGSLLPIASERIVPTRDLDRLQLGESEFSVLHTPGHALHHQALFDPAGSLFFSGDTFGMAYRALASDRGAFIVPTTTPTQFDPEQLVASVRRLLALGADAAYLTHYGRVTGLPVLAAALEEQIEQLVEIARRHQRSTDRLDAIQRELRALWIQRLRAHGAEPSEALVDDWLSADAYLNAQGLVAWLERSEKPREDRGPIARPGA